MGGKGKRQESAERPPSQHLTQASIGSTQRLPDAILGEPSAHFGGKDSFNTFAGNNS